MKSGKVSYIINHKGGVSSKLEKYSVADSSYQFLYNSAVLQCRCRGMHRIVYAFDHYGYRVLRLKGEPRIRAELDTRQYWHRYASHISYACIRRYSVRLGNRLAFPIYLKGYNHAYSILPWVETGDTPGSAITSVC